MAAAAISPAVRSILRFLLGSYRYVALCFLSLKEYVGRLVGRNNPKPYSTSERRVVMGESWNEFCDTLKAAGAAMMAPGAPTDPFTQAEGYRYLSRLARAGLENYVECNNVLRPQLCAIANGNRAARICIGSDNPDNLYENATIDSRLAYVVKGYRGTVPYLGLGTQSGRYGAKGGLQTIDYIDANDLIYEDDDSEDGNESMHGGLRRTSNDDSKGKYFKIILSKNRPIGANNWLRLSSEIPEAMFIVRQTFGKRNLETPASLQISLYGHVYFVPVLLKK